MPPDREEVARRVRDLIAIPPPVAELAGIFTRAGHELYLVGGSVRDALLGRLQAASHRGHEPAGIDGARTAGQVDLDFATDARPDEVLEIVRDWHEGTWLTGVQFGTVGLKKGDHRLEITTFRGERYREDSRQPEVHPVPSIEEDLARRDFTINAMAFRLADRAFTDPFEGIADLAARRLRTPRSPEESFGDDPLRMLRAARFVATLGAEPDPGLVEAMRAQRDRLRIVSAERIRDEISKILAAERPSLGLDLATETGLCEIVLPELPALKLEQDPVHRHKDVYRHTLAVVDNVAAADPGPEPDVALRVAALLHDIGKPATRRITPEGVTFHHHEVVGARMTAERLRALRYPSDFIDTVARLVELHLRFHTYRGGWTDSAVRRYVRDAGPLLDRLNRLVRADCTTRNRFKAKRLAAAMEELEERIARLAAEEDLKRIRPSLDGREVMAHLGIEPGPLVGEALGYLLDVRLERGEIPKQEAYGLLDEWAAGRGLGPGDTSPG